MRLLRVVHDPEAIPSRVDALVDRNLIADDVDVALDLRLLFDQSGTVRVIEMTMSILLTVRSLLFRQ